MSVSTELLAVFATPEGRRAPRSVAVLGAGAGALEACVARRVPGAKVHRVEASGPRAEELASGSCDLVLIDPGGDGQARERLGPMSRAARQLLGRGGRVAIGLPASAVGWMFGDLEAAGLIAKRMRAVHPGATEPASAVLVEAQAGRPGGLVVESPWFVSAG